MERKKEFKSYEAPEMEVVDVELEGAILGISGEGGGVSGGDLMGNENDYPTGV